MLPTVLLMSFCAGAMPWGQGVVAPEALTPGEVVRLHQEANPPQPRVQIVTKLEPDVIGGKGASDFGWSHVPVVSDFRRDGDRYWVQSAAMDPPPEDPWAALVGWRAAEGAGRLRLVQELSSRPNETLFYQQDAAHAESGEVIVYDTTTRLSPDGYPMVGEDLGSPMRGYLKGDPLPLGERFAGAIDRVRRVEGPAAWLNGREMILLRLDIPEGNYSIWLDPEHGYNIARAVVSRGPENLFLGEPLSDHVLFRDQGPPSGADEITEPRHRDELLVTGFGSVRDASGRVLWYPESGVYETVRVTNRGRRMQYKAALRRVVYTLDPPEHPFTISAPDGTRARFVSRLNEGVPREWRDGRIQLVVDHDRAAAATASVRSELANIRSRPSAAGRFLGMSARSWTIVGALAAMAIVAGLLLAHAAFTRKHAN